MAEFLVRVVDKVNEDPVLNAGCTKRGHVISVCPDGHQWSPAELAGNPWVVLRCPNITLKQAATWLGAQTPNANELNIDRRLFSRRHLRLNMDDRRVADGASFGQLVAASILNARPVDDSVIP